MVKYWSGDNRTRYADGATKHGRQQRLIANIHKLFDWELTGTEETALIVADVETSPAIYHTMAGVLSTFDVETTISIIPQQDNHNMEPPSGVAAAAPSVDVIVNVGRYALLHSDAMQHAIHECDVDYLYLADTTEDYYARGAIEADPETLDTVTQRVSDRLSTSDHVEVTTPEGTDVELRVAQDRRAPLVGYPAGEAPVSPIEESVTGTIVIDSYMMGVGLLEEPITWEVDAGWIESISGGREAAELRRVIDEYGDENARRIAEFSIMTNEHARPNGIYIEHLSVGGGTHFALGNGTALGGQYSSSIHLDGAQLSPTVIADGDTLVRDGTITI